MTDDTPLRSCVNCIHGKLEITPAYWEFPEEADIGCAYPTIGDLGKNRKDLVDWFGDDMAEEAENCESYQYDDKIKENNNSNYSLHLHQELIATIDRVKKLKYSDEEDEYGDIIKPTEYATKIAIHLLFDVATLYPCNFFKAWVCAENSGGIYLTWSKPESEKELRVLIPAKEKFNVYLYYENQQEYGSEDNASAKSLSKWIEWVNS